MYIITVLLVCVALVIALGIILFLASMAIVMVKAGARALADVSVNLARRMVHSLAHQPTVATYLQPLKHPARITTH
jgi:hypothetical protein